MQVFLDKFYRLIDKIGKHNFILIVFIFIVLISTGVYQTFSLYTESTGLGIIDGIETYSFILNANNEVNEITIASGNSKYIDITVANESKTDLLYGLYYMSDGDINIGYKFNTAYLPNGIITANTKYNVTLKIDNNTDSNVNITFGVKYGFESGGDLVLNNGEYLIDKYKNIPNAPNLDNGNLIPVYYDEEGEVWKKADSSNVNNSWYDYENKMWANVVLVNDYDKNEIYQGAEVGSIINEEDITAFYVWIPRFKYRVWNMNRQGGAEDTYAYSAYTTGIEIDFENGINSTGNVKCTYDTNLEVAEDKLIDSCYFKEEENPINKMVANDYYKDDNEAWYTHPAFTFGDKEITGFWIGKFETTGDVDNPTILPDTSSLRDKDVLEQFEISKLFQKYLSINTDAHLMTNLEWGAVAYLTHSTYGLCDEISCSDVYLNNSSGYYTGRSGGFIAGNILDEATFYEDESLTKDSYNLNGYYDYKGYKLDSKGAVTDIKDITKVASTTRNITGVYDMSGGAREYVMGNMVNSLGVIINRELANLDSQYAFGDSYADIFSYNRARLGDATAEVLGEISDTGAWQPGNDIIGTYSNFVYNDFSWFTRGGDYSNDASGIFNFSGDAGFSGINDTFRSSLS